MWPFRLSAARSTSLFSALHISPLLKGLINPVPVGCTPKFPSWHWALWPQLPALLCQVPLLALDTLYAFPGSAQCSPPPRLPGDLFLGESYFFFLLELKSDSTCEACPDCQPTGSFCSLISGAPCGLWESGDSTGDKAEPVPSSPTQGKCVIDICPSFTPTPTANPESGILFTTSPPGPYWQLGVMTEEENWQRPEVVKIYIGRRKGYPRDEGRGKTEGERGTVSKNTSVQWFLVCNFIPLLWRGFSCPVPQGAAGPTRCFLGIHSACSLPSACFPFSTSHSDGQSPYVCRVSTRAGTRQLLGFKEDQSDPCRSLACGVRRGSEQPGSKAGTLANSASAFQDSLLAALIFTAVGCCSPVCLNALHFLSSLTLLPIASTSPAGCQRSR